MLDTSVHRYTVITNEKVAIANACKNYAAIALGSDGCHLSQMCVVMVTMLPL